MCDTDNNENDWKARKMFLMEMLTQTLGLHTLLYIPHQAVSWGAAGQSLCCIFLYIGLGMPLLYMECVVGQFTGRDCLEVWQARAWLSHLGYIHVFWQIINIFYLQTINSFIVHYLLISFENPIPYYMCGPWSKPDCNILASNYSVNQDCLKIQNPLPYCSDLCHTFPEYQYWRFFVLGLDKDYFFMAWHVCLASAFLSIFLFICCFRGRKFLNCILVFVTVFPTSCRFLFMIGSMLQKGLVVKYEEAFDTDFSVFNQQFSLSSSIAEMVYSLNLGSGLSFCCASRTSFRAPCYSNSVIVVVITSAVVVLGIFSTVMLTCPYAFKYDIKPNIIMSYPMANIFERLPRLIHVYESTSLWLVLSYGYIAISTVGLSINIISSLIEMLTKRYYKLAKHPGLLTFVILLLLYVLTAPLLGMSLYLLVDIKRTTNVLMLFLTSIETIVFVLWYGLEKFSDDIHFMQGVPPKVTVKLCWLASAVVLVYVFITQLYKTFKLRNDSLGSHAGWWMVIITIAVAVLVALVKLAIGLYKKKSHELFSLNSAWGPKSELLKRSRAMFTAQAMTKEYMYRQYHLQAGILMRQKRSNVRSCYMLGFTQRPDNTRQDV